MQCSSMRPISSTDGLLRAQEPHARTVATFEGCAVAFGDLASGAVGLLDSGSGTKEHTLLSLCRHPAWAEDEGCATGSRVPDNSPTDRTSTLQFCFCLADRGNRADAQNNIWGKIE